MHGKTNGEFHKKNYLLFSHVMRRGHRQVYLEIIIMYLNGWPQIGCLRANWVFNPDSLLWLWLYDPSILSIRHVGLIPSGSLEPNSIRMMRKCWIELEKHRN